MFILHMNVLGDCVDSIFVLIATFLSLCFAIQWRYFRKQYFFLIFIYSFIYSFIYGCVGSSFLCEGSLQLRQAGATPHHGARASHCSGLSCCGAQAPDAQAQQLWLTGVVAPRHVGSSQTRARTRVPCIGRQTLNHCATREAPRKQYLRNIGIAFWYTNMFFVTESDQLVVQRSLPLKRKIMKINQIKICSKQ